MIRIQEQSQKAEAISKIENQSTLQAEQI